MNWKELLTVEIENAYATTEGLLEKVSDGELNWKPSDGSNWMTMGQLLCHIASACGVCFKGFITGDWGMPEDMDLSDLKPEDMLPPAEKFPTVESVEEAKRGLAEDKRIAYEMLEQVSEDNLANQKVTAPWDPREKILGLQLLHMIYHLKSHKSQLFYYLKLQGKQVNTADLWGG
ncbi:MAG: DinB family protein [Candidatus Omnitrophica bacterium]|nr:DinB family protein [Candidatus Omnitrophota bacterium]